MKSINSLIILSRRFFEVLSDEGIGTAYKKTKIKLMNRLRLEQNREAIFQTDETHFSSIYKTYITTGQNKTGGEYVSLPTYDLTNESLPVRTIAFYLPQYHPIPENDDWWGKGFTDWTNVSKAAPNFVGHYQPHIPAELGFYDLRVQEVQQRQVELAKKFGLQGFCFYYYWFNGKRLLKLPLEQYIRNPKIDFPFCLCWANENWTRTWDGLDNEVLIAQNYSPESDLDFIKDIIPYLTHERYIRINGLPVLLVYRPQSLPDPAITVKSWRTYYKDAGLGDLFLVAVQSGRIIDPRSMGFDAATEFPPHGIPFLPQINSQLKITNPDFDGMVFDYQHVANQMSTKESPAYKLFKAVVTGWDNTPRKQDHAMIFHNSSPQIYHSWLSSAINYMLDNAPKEERLVFINAWNEWAEGTYLEPDRKFGYAYLDATARALNPALNNEFTLLSNLQTFSANKKNSNTAVVLHLFYPELWEETLHYLENLTKGFDFYVSIPENVNFNSNLIRQKFPHAVIYKCVNRGRDIAPFLRLFSLVNLLGYQYVCKIHTKKSLHRPDGTEWRTEILDELLGSESQINVIKGHLDLDQVGIIGPKDHIISTRHFIGSNQLLINDFSRKLGLDYSGEIFNFIGGSMFWFKPAAIAPILKLDLDEADFPEETGQTDATPAHAIERVLCLLAIKQGYQVIQTGTFSGETNDAYNYADAYKGTIYLQKDPSGSDNKTSRQKK